MIKNGARYLLLFTLLGCGGGVIQRIDYATPKPESGVLVVSIIPRGGSLFIDGKYSGEIDRYASGGRIPIPVGKRRLRIERLGYYSWYDYLDVGPREYPLRIKLVKMITAENPAMDAGNRMKTSLE